MSCRSRRRTALLVLAAVAVWPAGAAAAQRPNVVVVETDDQTVADMASMPRTRGLIGAHGVTFRRSFVSESQCCPSRATFLTGRYAHNHGVLTTQPPFGGYHAFDPSESVAVWLQRAGYATGLVGKYLNNYGREDPTVVPPGWTEWRGLIGRTVYSYYGYALNEDGRIRRYPGRYQTDVLTRLSVDYIRRRARGDKPFFLWTTYVAPHGGWPRELLDPLLPSAVAAPLYHGAFFAHRQPRGPAFGEADVSDKPRPIARRRPLSPARRAAIAHNWRQRQESLLSVDAGVARIVRALRRAGVLRDTLVVFTSDNGFLLGEHRVPTGKILPYEPSIRVPLLLRGPGLPAGVVRRQLVWNGDLAPTILEAAGAAAAWPLDGRSLLPFARHARAHSRRVVLLEGPPEGRLDATPRFTGLRTERYKYVEYRDGERELYDLRRDPSELENGAGDPAKAAVLRRLARRLAALRHCRGASCRR